jgi:Winged helix DNA-binding domain
MALLVPDRLDRRRLNRATLARQLLLERAELTTLDAVEHLVGLQAQAPQSIYVSLWSRLARFDPVAAGEALERRDLVRTHAMRATVHLFSRTDALRLRALMQPMLDSRFRSAGFPRDLPGVDLDALRRVAREVATPEPLTRVQLGRRLAETFPGVSDTALAYAATYLEPLVQVPPRGVWRRRGAVHWQTYRGWLGVDAGPAARIEDVLLRYLAAFGPAGVADMRIWSGLPGLREVVDRLRPRLRVFLDESGQELVDLPDAPRPEPDVPAPVRFLPEYDNVLLSHADRTRVIPDRRAVPLPPGEGARVGTVLVDGVFRATWRLLSSAERTVIHVDAEPRLSAPEADAVVDEARRLAGFLRPAEIPTDIVLG